MADSVVTLTPNADALKPGWTRVGGASDHAALTDASDATYMTNQLSANPGNYVFLGLPAHTFAATDQLKAVAFRFRCSSPDYQNISCKLTDNTTIVNLSGGTGVFHPSTSIQTLTGSLSIVGQPYADPTVWNTYNTPGVLLEFGNIGGGGGDGSTNVYVYETTVYLTYNQAPTAAVNTPSISSLKPSVSWTYTDAEGDVQERFKVRIFSAAQYGISNFDPETSPNTYDSGEQSGFTYSGGTYTFQGVTTNLTVGTTYKAYVKVADAGSSGRYGTWAASSAFVPAPSAPVAPTLTSAADYSNQRIALTLTPGNINLLGTNQASFESGTVVGWGSPVNITGGYPAALTTFAKDGNYSLGLSSLAAGNMSLTTSIGQNGIPVQANTAYEALASFTCGTTARNCNVGIKWWKSDGTASAHPLDTGANVGDGVAGTFSQTVLSVTSPADAAYASVIVTVLATGGALEAHFVDKVSLAPGSSTTWQPGGAFNAIIQKSEDNGLTWSTLKRPNPVSPATANSSGVITFINTLAAVTAYDYESIRGNGTLYRSYVYATDPTNGELDSAVSAQTGSDLSLVNNKLWNFKVCSSPSLNQLNMTTEFQSPFLNVTRHETGAFFTAIGRTRKIKISDAILGDEFQITVTCTTAAQYNGILAVINAQSTVLVQSPDGTQWYVGIDLDETEQISQIPSLYYRAVTFNCIEVDVP